MLAHSPCSKYLFTLSAILPVHYNSRRTKTLENTREFPVLPHFRYPCGDACPPGAHPTEEYVRFHIAHNFLFVC
jgi:hypothetical protein